MKKILLFGLLASFSIGCSTAEYHQGRQSIRLQNIEVEPQPLQANIQVGPQISGVAECESWFGFRIKKPKKQTFGAGLQVTQGNFAPDPCTRGAIYDALTKNNADIIITPRYTSVKKGNLCIFGLCLNVVDQIIVTGYKGKVTNIRPMDEDVIKARRMTGINAHIDAKEEKATSLFGLF